MEPTHSALSDRPRAAHGPNHGGGQAETLAEVQSPVETRTSAPSGRACQLCGQPVTGRRRNQFCSDRCRLRVKRATRTARLESLFKAAEQTLADLRREVMRQGNNPRSYNE
jgi:predicted nucleic acid-binding Zn ribbon protein